MCALCKAEREEELERRRAGKANGKSKGKGKAEVWDDADDADEPDGEWGFGEPGIMKVSTGEALLTCSPTLHSLAKLSIRPSTIVFSRIERKSTCSSSSGPRSRLRQSARC